MELSAKAQNVIAELGDGHPMMGAIKKIAAAIKKDHDLALELWATGQYYPRLVSTLTFDKMQLTQEKIEELAKDIEGHNEAERGRLSEWLLAHQLMKSKKTIALLESWQHHASPILRRLFWYHQVRLRWTGQVPPDNSVQLLTSLKQEIADEVPDVQWAMNFAACQIGLRELEHRAECIELGERLGLYKELKASKGCTPWYLPEYIEIEAAKLAKKQ